MDEVKVESNSPSDPFNLSTDPYLARGPTGTFHCKKCLTTHPTEANYLIHRDGRRHKAAIDRSKKYQELASAQKLSSHLHTYGSTSKSSNEAQEPLNAPRPAFEVVRAHDPSTDGWTIRVIVEYPNCQHRPVYRIISMHEQKVETVKDMRYMFLVIGCISFRNIAIKIPNTPRINRRTIHTTWDEDKFSLQFCYHANDQHLEFLTKHLATSETLGRKPKG